MTKTSAPYHNQINEMKFQSFLRMCLFLMVNTILRTGWKKDRIRIMCVERNFYVS